MKSVGVIGCGVWATTLAISISKNVKKLNNYKNNVYLWTFEILINRRKLSGIINKERENVKYLPGVYLPDNIFAESNLSIILSKSDILFFAIPQKYSEKIIKSMKNILKPNIFIFCITKGIYYENQKLIAFSSYLKSHLNINCAVLKGSEIFFKAEGGFIGTLTIGSDNLKYKSIADEVLKSNDCKIKFTQNHEFLDFIHSLSSILSFSIGIFVGYNTTLGERIEFMRNYTFEIVRLCKSIYSDISTNFINEHINVKENIINIFSGRNFYSGKILAELQLKPNNIDLIFNGQVTDVCETIFGIYNYIETCKAKEKYPILTCVYEICFLEKNSKDLLKYMSDGGYK
ncbi:Glycerol-3-phosphate dehydrogenase NAD(P) [Spraguea lophii 42_110]|uniref:Glycerol-3-phosphate dehydrogenase [NAD(+)] n=1 Tax=Spraguea lophii (strain 42_110) TaxID=1358809 RepID=S7XIH5_SPRLO|nr:Glycerol-3-phosphate dehydrogenase NAD(P) [Spraguea lophii 42_110]